MCLTSECLLALAFLLHSVMRTIPQELYDYLADMLIEHTNESTEYSGTVDYEVGSDLYVVTLRCSLELGSRPGYSHPREPWKQEAASLDYFSIRSVTVTLITASEAEYDLSSDFSEETLKESIKEALEL